MTEYKITLPPLKLSPKERESKLKRMFNENQESAQTLIFSYLNQPATTTEIVDALKNYYQHPFDRTTTYRILKDLTSQGILFIKTSTEAVTTTDNSPVLKKIKAKYYKFIQRIPPHFRTRFKLIYYFGVTDFGKEFIPWCCKLLNFEMEEEK